MSLNAGYFSNSIYDKQAYEDRVYESTGAYAYTMNTDKIYNCNGCLTTFGPRCGYMGAGVSSITNNKIAEGQHNIDMDTIMSNRNVKYDKSKKGHVNPVDLKKIKTYPHRVCNDYLDTRHSRLTDNAMFYRDATINRFYDLNKDPQSNIFYDWAINTSLEERDNYVPRIPKPLTDVDLVPNRNKSNTWSPCTYEINDGSKCKFN